MTDVNILDRYQDGGQVSPWARDAVAFAITNKLLEPHRFTLCTYGA